MTSTVPTHTGTSPAHAKLDRPPTPRGLHEFREVPSYDDDFREDEEEKSVSDNGDKREDDEEADTLTPPRSRFLDDIIYDDSSENAMDFVSSDTQPAPPESIQTPIQPRTESGGTPYPRRKQHSISAAASVESVLTRLAAVNLADDSMGTPPHQPRRAAARELKVAFCINANEVVCAPVPASGDGSVVVLTPRRASKKEKDTLGVDSVVTNARRSLRLMPGIAEHTTPRAAAIASTPVVELCSSSDAAAAAQLRVQKMLEENGNAFVPNKVLAVGHASPVRKASQTPKPAMKGASATYSVRQSARKKENLPVQ
ncbi:hypothetical protein HDU84_002531 [Entophlyctis sp. JEL0112]|nr:hypothetical protein HDU84_002531 [Entophlyctis sp. JEL0112]